jgi:hypothetical protein
MTAMTEFEKPNSLPYRKDPPEHLYHYTSIDGLERILTERCLWASQIHFLNDVQEFKYSLYIFEKVLAELLKEFPKRPIPALGPPRPPREPKEFLAEFYRRMREFLLSDLFERTPVCVFSLSEKGDLLSQWRGYCPPGGGYSIGFRSDPLVQFLNTCDLYIEPCVYDEREQEAIVKRAVAETGETALKSFPGPPAELHKAVTECLVQFFIDFSRIASIVKHPSFHEECEWRIISKPIENKYMSFRVRKSILIPYFSISFKDVEPCPIDEIIIGPSPEQDLAKYSLLQFVLRNSLRVSMKTSETPYREL